MVEMKSYVPGIFIRREGKTERHPYMVGEDPRKMEAEIKVYSCNSKNFIKISWQKILKFMTKI
jgi:hypothetical protein